MEYKLIDIKDWYKRNNKLIPEIQRDLVWSSKQIVMLWDSILRGFPIGSFIILEDSDGKLQVLDGQQRINAIAQGFGTYMDNNSDSDTVLWLDICGKPQDTKQYPIMITTKSQPWGYKSNDECSKLSSNERRDALLLYFGKNYPYESIYTKSIDLYSTWPYKSKMPIPLPIILKHIDAPNENDFRDRVKADFLGSCFSVHDRIEYQWDELIKFFDSFHNLINYSIGNPTLSNASISNDSDLVLLFERITNGGTNIHRDDLAYSIIKAHFKGIGIKEKDSIVLNNISPAKLARFLLRIADSKKSESFVGDFEYQKIREYSQKKDFKACISEYYNNIKDITSLIESIFDTCNVPKFLRVEIANKSTELYMLLVYIAICKIDTLIADSKMQHFLCGLVLYLKWFCNNLSIAVNVIKKHIDNNFSYNGFKIALSEILGLNILTPFITPNQFKNMFVIEAGESWIHRQHNYPELWNKVKEKRELLIFFQREYIKNTFGSYNPLNSKLWDDNRPWDYDHIIPQNWFGNYSTINKYARFNKYWMNNIGNLAAIPFERNRSKRDNGDWGYYEKTGLLEKSAINSLKTINPEYFNKDIDPQNNSGKKYSMAQRFAELTFHRCCLIYSDCYDNLFESLSLCEQDLTQLAKERKKVFEQLNKALGDLGEKSGYYYVTQDESRELAIDTNWSWNMRWMSCGIIVKGDYYVALTCFLDYDAKPEPQLVFEIGIRRHPEEIAITKTNILPELSNYTKYIDNNWWYIERDINNKKEIIIDDKINENIIKEMMELKAHVEKNVN